MNSTHKIEVVPLVLRKHPTADTLSIASIDGYECVTGTDQWVGCDRAVYIPPDNVVDTRRPEFAFLSAKAKPDGTHRVKAIKLRGHLSFGLLVPAPEGSQIGDDVTEALGVVHYSPPSRPNRSALGGVNMGAEEEYGPTALKYDLEAGRKFGAICFTPGQPVLVHEKIHGANARYTFSNGRMYAGSRTQWKREYPDFSHCTRESLLANGCVEEKVDEVLAKVEKRKGQQSMWWQVLTPELRAFCEAHPNVIVYGEVFGAVQDLPYGHKAGEVSFLAFDIWDKHRWWTPEECRLSGLPWVPLIATVPYDPAVIAELAEGKSTLANHVREGVVVRPVGSGQPVLKWVGGGYLMRSNDDFEVSENLS